jgi:pyruvate/2-oxoacid:ferredoxin oxidoreductase beta subunit
MKRFTLSLLALILTLTALSCLNEENTNTAVAPARPLVSANSISNSSRTQSANAQPKNTNSTFGNTSASASPAKVANNQLNRGGQRTDSTIASLGDDYYINSKGVRVRRPVRSSSAPAGATARCGDGTYSFSQSRRGTCSHHGGVVEWL